MSGFKDIMKSLEQAIDYEKGNIKTRGRTIMIEPIKDYESKEIRNLRLRFSLSQLAFAAVMGVSQKTVEAWESGRNEPSGPARRMMQIITSKPEVLEGIIQLNK